MRKVSIVLLLALAAGGCGGYYTLTVGDHVGPVGGEGPVVARLRRNDFFVLNLPMEDAAMRFRIGEGLERVAYTDENGYAGTTLPAPARAGRYTLHVNNMDSEGEETAGEALIFVWDPTDEVLAVDADALPRGYSDQVRDAGKALRRLGENANILYLTRRGVRRHEELRRQLAGSKYPDGAILPWARERWRVVRRGRFNLPRVIVETRLISQLPELRKMFPRLSAGVCASKIAARAFAGAGMRVVIVGSAPLDLPNRIRRGSWADLGERGI